MSEGSLNVAGSELRSARLLLNLGDFCRSLSFCRVGQVAWVFEDETHHSTRQSRVLMVETRHRPVSGVSLAVTGWSVPMGLQFAWTPLLMAILSMKFKFIIKTYDLNPRQFIYPKPNSYWQY